MKKLSLVDTSTNLNLDFSKGSKDKILKNSKDKISVGPTLKLVRKRDQIHVWAKQKYSRLSVASMGRFFERSTNPKFWDRLKWVTMILHFLPLWQLSWNLFGTPLGPRFLMYFPGIKALLYFFWIKEGIPLFHKLRVLALFYYYLLKATGFGSKAQADALILRWLGLDPARGVFIPNGAKNGTKPFTCLRDLGLGLEGFRDTPGSLIDATAHWSGPINFLKRPISFFFQSVIFPIPTKALAYLGFKQESIRAVFDWFIFGSGQSVLINLSFILADWYLKGLKQKLHLEFTNKYMPKIVKAHVEQIINPTFESSRVDPLANNLAVQDLNEFTIEYKPCLEWALYCDWKPLFLRYSIYTLMLITAICPLYELRTILVALITERLLWITILFSVGWSYYFIRKPLQKHFKASKKADSIKDLVAFKYHNLLTDSIQRNYLTQLYQAQRYNLKRAHPVVQRALKTATAQDKLLGQIRNKKEKLEYYSQTPFYWGLLFILLFVLITYIIHLYQIAYVIRGNPNFKLIFESADQNKIQYLIDPFKYEGRAPADKFETLAQELCLGSVQQQLRWSNKVEPGSKKAFSLNPQWDDRPQWFERRSQGLKGRQLNPDTGDALKDLLINEDYGNIRFTRNTATHKCKFLKFGSFFCNTFFSERNFGHIEIYHADQFGPHGVPEGVQISTVKPIIKLHFLKKGYITGAIVYIILYRTSNLVNFVFEILIKKRLAENAAISFYYKIIQRGVGIDNNQQKVLKASELFLKPGGIIRTESQSGIKKAFQIKSLVIKELDYRYPETEKLILNNINLDLPFGDRIALIGPSGSGKTTLSRLISGFPCAETPQNLNFKTVDLKDRTQSIQRIPNIRQVCRLLPQESEFYEQTILSNLLLDIPKKYHLQAKSYINQLLDALELKNFDLQELLFNNGTNLSGGQKQRFALVRLMVQQKFNCKPLVVFDESLSALDQNNKVNALNLLAKELKDTVSLSIIHDLSILQHYNRIIYLDQGAIIFDGPYAKFLKSPIYSKYKQVLDLEKAKPL